MTHSGTIKTVTKFQGNVVSTIVWYVEPTPPFISESAQVTVPPEFEQAFWSCVGKSANVTVDANGSVTGLTVKG